MALGSCSSVPVSLLLLLSFLNSCAAINIITSSQFINDSEFIVSTRNVYKLGFFSPVNSTYRYVGIWPIKVPEITPLWVANRNNPLSDSSGVMKISDDGNLVVLDGKQEILWSSNVSSRAANSSALLTDDGNLILQDGSNGNSSLWESFQHPSDTYLKKMKLTNEILLTSWKSPSDPSIGSFSSGVTSLFLPEIFIWNGSDPYWRTGPWTGQVFIGINEMNSVYIRGFNVVEENDGTYSVSANYFNDSLVDNFFLTYEGQLAQKHWEDGAENWIYDWRFPGNQCDVYGMCGENGICNIQNSPICSCLDGFEPKNGEEWSKGNWTSGCVRRTLLQCERTQNGSEVGKEDRFLKLKMAKVPASALWLESTEEQNCRDECLGNCSCRAYTYVNNFGCLYWTGSLIDIQQFSTGGADLNVRLAYSELGERRSKKALIISITVTFGAIVLVVCAVFAWRCIAKYRERKGTREEVLLSKIESEASPMYTDGHMLGDDVNQAKLQELPLFNLQMLATATNHFDISNKLGRGGFGLVYKGKLPNGQEIAVKRLSTTSGQGLDEFMNEVVVISKLQHRNLVRLLGCCVERDEKMLVYEYMPNKSLDALLFDPSKQELRDWKTRFNIIEGICRGLLYLHRDSRLKIIHRDLKPSNILLDQELNPKISDFGMARIFGGNQDQGNTLRVVGTFGYMSPEYAMEGRFSEKSDVFSLGVLLLEIVSGRKNTGFYDDVQALSLTGFAWKLWSEGNSSSLIDPGMSAASHQKDILRCIHVGLLCVQELPSDRPNVPTIISMLKSEIVDLPTPKQPAFIGRQTVSETESSQHMHCRNSINSVTITAIQGR